MSEKKPDNKLHIEFTEEQKKLIREKTGKDLDATELHAEELEDRIAPFAPFAP